MLWQIFRVALILASGLGLYFFLARTVAKFKIPPPPLRERGELEHVDLEFRCAVCGAEMLMRSTPADEEIVAPRHCREDMLLATPHPTPPPRKVHHVRFTT